MVGYINGTDWLNAEPMKYWTFPKSSKEDKKANVYNYIMSNEYLGSLKVDGFYERILKDEDGNCFMISRSKNVQGEAINKIDWVPQLKDWMEDLPNGTCLLSECFLPNNEGSKKITSLLGCLAEKCISRQNKNGKLHFYIFDVMAWNNKNFTNDKAEERFEFLMNELPTLVKSSEYIKYAKYFTGDELWKHLQYFLAEDREGMVITRKDCPVYFKRTPARKTIKIKKELREDIDCFFTGNFSAPTALYTGKKVEEWTYWRNSRTYELLPIKNYFKEYIDGEPIEPVTKSYYFNLAGSLEIGVFKDGKVKPIGMLSGLEEEIKKDPQKYSMKPIRVTAMEIDSINKTLRHGKFIEFRTDIDLADCTYEKIFG